MKKVFLPLQQWCCLWRVNLQQSTQSQAMLPTLRMAGVSISIDHESDAWTKVIKEKELQWVNVNVLFEEDNGAAKLYGVRGIPSNYLIDCSTGTIIANHLRGEELLDKLGEVLK